MDFSVSTKQAHLSVFRLEAFVIQSVANMVGRPKDSHVSRMEYFVAGFYYIIFCCLRFCLWKEIENITFIYTSIDLVRCLFFLSLAGRSLAPFPSSGASYYVYRGCLYGKTIYTYMMVMFFYLLFLLLFDLVTWSFAGTNFPFITKNILFDAVHAKQWIPAVLYSVLVVGFFIFYFYLLSKTQKKLVKSTFVWKLILLTIFMLIPSFPAFWSHDIFNYMATAKVTFSYRENPYIVMPIELPNEPLLSFMHAANKVALYGPAWIASTFIPYSIGRNNILGTMYAFKIFIALFYLGLCWLIWRISNKNIRMLAFFAFNPLVVAETLISSHNDVAMMFFALGSFYLLKQKKIGISMLFLIFSIFIKFATLFLLPIYLFALYLTVKKKSINWSSIWFWASITMYIIFFLSPIREELYSWYLIWPIVFVSLLPEQQFLQLETIAFSFGLLFRVTPFLLTLSWGGLTPTVKKIVTFIPPLITGAYYAIRKKI